MFNNKPLCYTICLDLSCKRDEGPLGEAEGDGGVDWDDRKVVQTQSKGSIFNSWLIDKLVCIFHWGTMGGYWGSFCKYNHVLYEGNVNWVLKTCPLNIKFGASEGDSLNDGLRGLQREDDCSLKMTWINRRPEPCLRG